MKICVAQTRPIKGDIPYNLENHIRLIDLAVSQRTDLLIFPELSLTGYEPELAQALAMRLDDDQFDDFQQLSNVHRIVIGVGAPIKKTTGVCIGLVLFQPDRPRQLYAKKYLHPDEEAFFVSGQSTVGLIGPEDNIALAICYELSVPEHAENAHRSNAEFYIASVAKSAKGVEKAGERLSYIARKYAMTVFMANCLGPSGNFDAAGKTAVWNKQGGLAGQLDEVREGIIMIDTATKVVMEKVLP